MTLRDLMFSNCSELHSQWVDDSTEVDLRVFLYEIAFICKILSISYCRHKNIDFRCSSYPGGEARNPKKLVQCASCNLQQDFFCVIYFWANNWCNADQIFSKEIILNILFSEARTPQDLATKIRFKQGIFRSRRDILVQPQKS